MLFHINHSSGVPVYLQIMEQVRHGVETGALRPGDQLPAIRKLAGDLVINPNTVVRAYRELEHGRVVELRQGSGAFISESVSERTLEMRRGRKVVQSALERLQSLGLGEEEIRRLVENELSALHAQIGSGKSNG
jgi:GntR family transcriptional regulator